MRSRGRLGLAALTVVAVVAAGVGLDRAEPAARLGRAGVVATSGAWLCPHGGGPEWQTDLYVANPGTTASEIRVTSLTAKRSGEPETFTVDPGTEIRVPAASTDPASSSFVEYFGGWVAAGWVTHAGGSATGAAAEPCAPEAGTHWFAADGTTQQGQDADLIVMNPFDVDAVIDVSVLSQSRAPIRNSNLTDLRIAPHRSLMLRLNTVSADEPAAAAEVLARTGRVAVSSLGISSDGGIRSALAVRSPTSEVFLAGTQDVGQSTLAVMEPVEREVRFGAVLLSGERPDAAAGITETALSGPSARAYPIITKGPSVVDLRAQAGATVVVVRRTEGQGGDPGATSGTAEPAAAWVVLPTVGGEPNTPGMVLGNPGSEPVEVSLSLLGETGVLDRIAVTVPATSAVDVPADFLQQDPTAAVVAVSAGAPFVTTGASSSLGQDGVAAYAVSAGELVPAELHLRP
ncbi:MAG: hypothetical protein QOI72_1243 [Solirubrobacterales bacterium]|nr:hypothetical protein [Solirubrobacterales bacterium]